MFKLWKLLTKQIKSHPLSTLFLMLGYIVSILMSSFGASNLAELKQISLERTEGAPKNALVINILLNNKYEYDKILNIFNDISLDSSMIFTDMTTFIDASNEEQIFPISSELFYSNPDWHYPLYSGRFYTADEIMHGDKIALLGKSLKKYTYKVKNKEYIKISSEEYEVVGYVGKEGKVTPWDDRIFIPLTALPAMQKSNIESTGSLQFILHNKKEQPVNDYEKIKNKVLSINKNAFVDIKELEASDDTIANLLGNSDDLITLTLLIYFIAVINSIALTTLWINDRKFEIGVRKAFGHTNYNISLLLFMEVLSITFVSCCISLLIQAILNIFVSNILGYTIRIYLLNFIQAIFITFITAFITSLSPIVKSLKIQPIELLKR